VTTTPRRWHQLAARRTTTTTTTEGTLMTTAGIIALTAVLALFALMPVLALVADNRRRRSLALRQLIGAWTPPRPADERTTAWTGIHPTTTTADTGRCCHGWHGPWNSRPCGCGRPATTTEEPTTTTTTQDHHAA
jgi:hypothetical protein